MNPVTIERLGKQTPASDIQGLAQLLVDAVASNAGVSFMADITQNDAETWWRSVLESSSERAIVLVARDAEGVLGTVQLQPSWAPNQPHRADVAKLIVHRRARRRGVGRALMEALEAAAAGAGFALLLLDTRDGDAAERLYVSLGWTRVGAVPGFAFNPDGTLCDTVFYYKQLGPPRASSRAAGRGA